jgi:hypothetical protein
LFEGQNTSIKAEQLLFSFQGLQVGLHAGMAEVTQIAFK